MKRIAAAALCLMLVFGMGGAMAKITIAAVDTGTGRHTSRTYEEGDAFRLRLTYDLAPYMDAMYCISVVEICGVEIDEPDITVRSGKYDITGVINGFPAYIRVHIEDIATGRELDSAEYHFRQAAQPLQEALPGISIPKTGVSGSAAPLAALCAAGAGILIIAARRR